MEHAFTPYQALDRLPGSRLLVLAPHPDDEVFGCGGALARHADAGACIRTIVLTDGRLAGGSLTADALVATREAESRAAAAALGTPAPEFWRLPDRGLEYSEALIHKLSEAIGVHGADLVFAPSLYEAHPDHRALAMAAVEAVRRQGKGIRLAMYEISTPIPAPDVLIDISPVIERKRLAMQCFNSQLALRRYDEFFEALGRYRTYTLAPHVKAAEAFEVIDAEALLNNHLAVFASEYRKRQAQGIPAIGSQDVPLVSVIVRSMERPTLDEALDSIALQTYPNIEVVLVNAKGTGHRPLPEWCGRFPLHMADSARPLKRSDAANVGIDSAHGELLIFLDDDDWFLPEHVAKLVSALTRKPDMIAAYSGIECIHDSETGRQVIRAFNEPFDAARLLVENTIPMHATLFRREAINLGNCRFDPTLDMFEDWDFWLQLLACGNWVHVPNITAVYRIHPGAGAGVCAAEDLAIAALDVLLAKWRLRWSAQQLRDLVAYTRRLRSSLVSANAHNEALDQEMTQMRKASATEIAAVRSALAVSQQQLTAIERSWSLRLARFPSTLMRKFATAIRIWQQGGRNELVWRLLLNIYRLPFLSQVLKLVPFSVKRRIRNHFAGAQISPAQPAFSGRLSDHPCVTILIPVYQHAKFIRDCIRSALAQTYANLEIIVVDDASPDPEVGAILAELEGAPRLVILRNERNLGISGAQNRGLLASRGEIIGFLDCDDLLAPDAVETSLRFWNPQTVYSHSARINIDEQGGEISRICFQHLPRQDYFVENLAAMYATHFKLIRRDVFARLGLFDSRFDAAQDYDFLMRVAAHYPSSTFSYVPNFVYYHRLHKKQATEVVSKQQAAAVTQIKKEAQLRRDVQNGKFDKKLSFIMLSFGKQSQTLDALRSIERTVRIPHEIILFDNGSSPETIDFIKNNIDGHFENLRIYYSDRNLGPAAGRRVALKHATGSWFVIFDNDEIAEPGWLEEMLVRAMSDERIGAVTSKVIFPNRRVQCSGGYLTHRGQSVVQLELHDRDADAYDLGSAQFRDCDWCPIGATLFTVNPAPFLHSGYPNIFEDAGVSFALQRQGYRLVNSPASWVWHEHVSYRKTVEMGDRYTRDRYDPQRMLISIGSFLKETGLLIYDEYVWRENQLNLDQLDLVHARLEKLILQYYPSEAAATSLS